MAESSEPTPAQPFVGRDAELDKLIRCWREAKDGQTRLALLLGDSGLGKTRLVQELYA